MIRYPEAFDILNREHDEIVRGIEWLGILASYQDVAKFRDQLKLVVMREINHFAHEERIMAALGYPGLEAHRNHHALTAEEIDRLLPDVEEDRLEPLFGRIIDHMRNGLADDLRQDQDFIAFLNQGDFRHDAREQRSA